MAIKVIKFSVRAGDVVYLPGDVIFDLDEAEMQKLVDGGYCEYDNSAQEESDQDLTADDGPLTIEQFTALKSDGQKELLGEQGIEAGSNEPTRIQQYTDWLAEQEGKQGSDNTSDTDAGGPKTGL